MTGTAREAAQGPWRWLQHALPWQNDHNPTHTLQCWQAVHLCCKVEVLQCTCQAAAPLLKCCDIGCGLATSRSQVKAS